MDFKLMMRLLRSLHEHAVDYVLVGAAAMSFLGVVRATEDIDIFVRPEEKNIERLRQAFLYEQIESKIIDFSGVPVCLATPRQLYEMKRGTMRAQDRADAEALREAFPREVD